MSISRPEKLKMETADMTAANIERIAGLFPNVITEIEDEDGNVRKGIDFDLLRQELSGDYVEGREERYDFTWVGKRQAIIESNRPIQKTLRPCIEESKDWENTENIYIEGDNLDALKLLQESYLNKVKMIYIDPPYNTGNDFIYNDKFVMGRDEYDEETGAMDEYGNRMFKNGKDRGRYHSDWCSMLYPRLKLARNLLREDGVIFVSIDDNEVHNLRKMMDEIFGEENVVGQIIWRTATDNNPTQIAVEHEYIVCYAKNKMKQEVWTRPSKKGQLIIDKYNELKLKFGQNNQKISENLKKWINDAKKNKEVDIEGVSHYTYVDDKGVYYPGNSANTKPGGYDFDIIHPVTGKVCAKPANGYRWPEGTFLKAKERGDVHWGSDHTQVPKIKKRIETATELLKSYYYEDNRASTNNLSTLMGKKVFDNPKSVNLINTILSFLTTETDIILDFFAGSGTTAHAVIQLNAEDGGNRKFIMVQLPETCDENTEAYKAGFKSISEIGKERIRRTGEQIKKEIEDENKQAKLGEEPKPVPDIGFRVFKICDTNMKDVYYSAAEYSQETIEGLVDNVKEDRTDLDLLYQVLINWGLPLDLKHEMEEIDGFTIHIVDTDALIACFEPNIPESVMRKIAERKPLRAVFRDGSFRDSPGKLNIEGIFKTIAPDTKLRVI